METADFPIEALIAFLVGLTPWIVSRLRGRKGK